MTGPLSGGARRRPPRRGLATVLTLLVVAAGLVGAGSVAVDPSAPLLALTGAEPSTPLATAERVIRRAAGAEEEPRPTAAAVDLSAPDAFALRFAKPPRAGLVFDLDTGRVLWRRNADARLPIASLTKVMTALLVVDRTTSRERVRITRAAGDYLGQGVGLPRGRRVPIEGLMHGMLLVSGNDAAKALAIHVGGSERRFVGMMNERARALGLRCTHFASADGIRDGNRSCAADVASMARLAMRERRISRVVRKADAAVRFPVRGGRLFTYSTNPLLRPRRYPGTVGLKTGFTRRAGRCYVGVIRRDGRRLGVVLLRSPDPAQQAKKLLGTALRRTSRASQS